MLKQSLLCTAVLCAGIFGPAGADQPGERSVTFPMIAPASPQSAHPQIVGYSDVSRETETQSETKLPVRDLLAAVSAWLSAQFDLPVADGQPRVELVPADRIAAIRSRPFGYLQAPAADVQAMLEAASTVMAVYEDATQTIYLLEGWTGVSPAEQSVLVHEMVHHLQSRGNLKYECPQGREKVAFAAQEQWLRRFERSLADEFGIDPFTLLVRTSCLG